MVETIYQHYEQLLGITVPWQVTSVELNHAAKSVTIRVAWPDRTAVPCPVCAELCTIASHREERSWRHLDTMQFATILQCRVPRARCAKHGVKTIHVPWASPGSRFTLLFESFAIDVLRTAAHLTAACLLLGISWDQAFRIMDKAVERGVTRRAFGDSLQHVGVDEKSFGKGQSYGSLLTDLDGQRVLEVVQGRKRANADELWATLPEQQRTGLTAVALDMWEPFMAAARAAAPQADQVHDKFHVTSYLTKAVDHVRRAEAKQLRATDNPLLTGTKYLWLRNPTTWSDEERTKFRSLQAESLKTGRAWAVKEAFTQFWGYRSLTWAKQFFTRWYFWATHSQLAPVVQAAKTLKRHLTGILAYVKHRITNAVTEGLNSKIQTLKANARGYRNFAHYRTAILFHCGKLSLQP